MKILSFFKLFCISSMLIIAILLTGGGTDYKEEKASEGYFKQLTMDSAGTFYVKQRVNERDSKNAGLVYHIEMDEQDKSRIKQITAYNNGHKVDTLLEDRYLGTHGKFHQIRISYENDTMKYDSFDSAGRAIPGFLGADSIRLQLDDNKKVTDIFSYSLGMLRDYDVPHHRISYDDKGRVSTVTPMDIERTFKVVLADLPASVKYEYDEKNPNRAVAITSLNQDGTVKIKHTLIYDEKGRVVRVENYLGESQSYDKIESLPLELEFIQGPLSFIRNFQGLPFYFITPVVEYVYNDSGLTAVRFKHSDGSPNGIGSYRGVRGHSIPERTGIAEIAVVRDKNGNILEIHTKGVDGKPIELNTKGATVIKLNYSGEGYIDSIEWLKDGQPVTTDLFDAQGDDVAKVSFMWEDEDRPSSWAFFGLDGKPVNTIGMKGLSGNQVYHKLVHSKNENGQVITIYYDAEGKEIKRL
ncbi:hypothetical protein [Veillonella agrestimuris]|uniref:hypothetical protein n=1 Tax=Veillonella agrestimuris TaxID=2941340 RepID=UPI00203E672C|nr:hypothetical protein [Veillonella agrestimuris]